VCEVLLYLGRAVKLEGDHRTEAKLGAKDQEKVDIVHPYKILGGGWRDRGAGAGAETESHGEQKAGQQPECTQRSKLETGEVIATRRREPLRPLKLLRLLLERVELIKVTIIRKSI
jgi:hypothetical protein